MTHPSSEAPGGISAGFMPIADVRKECRWLTLAVFTALCVAAYWQAPIWALIIVAWLLMMVARMEGWAAHERDVRDRVLAAGLEMIQNEAPMTAAEVVERRIRPDQRTSGPDHE